MTSKTDPQKADADKDRIAADIVRIDRLKSLMDIYDNVPMEKLMEIVQQIHEQGDETAEKMEEEDESSIRLYRGLKENYIKENYIKTIQDEDIEDDEGDVKMQRQKTADTIDPVKPTDALTKASISDTSDTRGDAGPSKDRNLLFKSPSVIVSVCKKPSNEEMQQDKVVINTPLQSLQAYGSDADEVVINTPLQSLQAYGSDDDYE